MPSRAVLVVAGCLALAAAPTAAAVPSPAASSYPPCLVTCPIGDLHFQVTVRDAASNPVPFATVQLDFTHCPGAFVCTSGAPDPYTWNPATRLLTIVASAAGQVDVPLRVGGVCGPGGVFLHADGVLFTSYALASPDQDGNGFVSNIILSDGPLFAGKLGGSDPTADFDCDGDVDAADQSTFFQHDSHGCDGFVDPTKRSTWGRVKTHYR